VSNWKIDRRRFITGAGAVFVLPLLEGLFPRKALSAGNTDPRRFVSLYIPNGTYNNIGDAVWYPPAGQMTAGTLPLVLSPFGANVGDFSVLMHPSCAARNAADSATYAARGVGGGHVSAVTTWLSQTVYSSPTSGQCSVAGSSFDQLLADNTGKPVLVLSGGTSTGSPDGAPFDYSDAISYQNGQPLTPHKNPVELYNAMFASLVPPDAGQPTPIAAAARNRSILDTATADIADLQSKLGKNDALKLEDYFTSIRDLETKLYVTTPPPLVSQCQPIPAPPESLDNVDLDGTLSSDYSARCQAFFDMVLLAFKCDLTRSVSFMYDGEVGARHLDSAVPSTLVYDSVDLSADVHLGISHYSSNTNGREKCISRDRYYLSQFFYLLNNLKGATDPSGSPILDNSILLCGFNVIDGSHNGSVNEGTPMIVGGGKNFMHPGNSFDLKGADMKDLFFTFNGFLGMGLPNFQGSSSTVSI
jgi:hypothetical protein